MLLYIIIHIIIGQQQFIKSQSALKLAKKVEGVGIGIEMDRF